MAGQRNGSKLKEVLNQISNKLGRGKRTKVRVGFLEGGTYPDGTSIPLVAAIMDTGSPANNIPPRPYFRNMIAEKKGEWPGALKMALKANDYDARKSLEIVGEGIAGQLRQSIANFDSVPLAPATIKRKGSDKQLIDTGVMLGSVDKEVFEE